MKAEESKLIESRVRLEKNDAMMTSRVVIGMKVYQLYEHTKYVSVERPV